MRLNLPRKLMLALALWAGTPTLMVLGHAVALPDRVGVFGESTLRNTGLSGDAITTYREPTDLGETYEFETDALMGFGPPETRTWHGLGRKTGAPQPAIILLHGSNRTGRAMLDMWQDVAEREELVLLAPDARGSHWSLVSDGPLFLVDVLNDAFKRYPIDKSQIYLMGHSDGGAHAMRLANLGVGPFKGVLSHAGHMRAMRVLPVITPVPVHGFIGDQDMVFSVKDTRKVLQQLSRAGHATSLTIVPNHGHWYYARGRSLAPVMWARLNDPAFETDAIPVAKAAPQPAPPVRQNTPSRPSGTKWIRVTPSQ